MSMISKMIERYKERKAAFREAETEDKVHTLIEQRKKNSNEKELERFYEEERQKEIKRQLDMFRKKRNAENNKTTIFDGKNMFTGHKSILTDNKKIFSDSQNSLHLLQGGRI